MKFDLGVSYPSMKIGSRGDFAVTRWDESHPHFAAGTDHPPPILVGQCKLRTKNVGQNIFATEILPSFNIDANKDCKLFIVAARGIANMEDYAPEGYFIWKMCRDKNGNLFLREMNKKQDKKADKHIVALGLNVLRSEDCFYMSMESVAKTDKETKRKSEHLGNPIWLEKT
jgi:hypothetical protein